MLGHRALNVEDYLAILKRRWWLIALPAVIFPILGYVYTFFVTPQFVSQTLVIIQQQEVPEDYVKPLVSEDIDSRIASMREQILSRSSLEPILLKYNLYGNEKMSMDDRIDLVRTNIGIKAIHSDIARSNGLPGFFITFKTSDAHTAQSVCDEIRALFITQNLRARTNAVEDTTNFLQSQRDEAKSVLDDQAKRLADFQRQYAGRLPGDTATNVNILNTLSTQLQSGTEQLSTMESNKTLLESVIAQQQSQTSSSPTGTIAQSPQTQQIELDRLLAEQAELKSHYTDANPDVKNNARKIEDLRQQMARTAAAPPPAPAPAASTPVINRADSAVVMENKTRLRALNDAIALKRKEADNLTQQIRRYQAAVESTPQVEEEFKSLTRDNQAAQANYDQLSAKMNQSKMATDLESRQQGEQFKTLDPANLPDGPIYPRKPVFVLGGLGAGLALGLVIVAIIEYKDTALRSERDVWAFTQLPTLAVIAWSGDVADTTPGRLARLKRLFSRKPKDVLADATG